MNGLYNFSNLLQKLEKRHQLQAELDDKHKELEELKEIIAVKKDKSKKKKKDKKKKRKKKNRNY